jgi:hypothetical protein
VIGELERGEATSEASNIKFLQQALNVAPRLMRAYVSGRVFIKHITKECNPGVLYSFSPVRCKFFTERELDGITPYLLVTDNLVLFLFHF